MKKTIFIFFMITIMLIAGCSNQDLNALNKEILEMRNKVESLLEEVDDLKALEEEFEVKFQEASSRIVELAEENETLNNLLNAQNPNGLTQTAACVMGLIKDQDYQGLSTYVHPTLGVRFSPYSYVDVGSHVVMQSSDIATLASNTTVYTWGTYDGIGNPISLNFTDYYNEFIYDHDFQTPELMAINNIVSSGNMINNISTVYPSAEYVEFHFSGFDAQYGGMDWSSLILVFQEVNGDYLLVGIVHSQWTI